MQRFSTSRLIIALTISSNSSEAANSPETEKIVPDSFADWLAQPSQVITADPAVDQVAIGNLVSASPMQPVAHLSLQARPS